MDCRLISLSACVLALACTLAYADDDLASDLAQVQRHWQAGEVRAALSYAHLTSGEHPDSMEALAWLVMIEDRVGQADSAMSRLLQALKERPRDEHLRSAMTRLVKDRKGCAAHLRATGIETGRLIPGRRAFALVPASGRPRLVPGLVTSGSDADHARFSAASAMEASAMLVFDATGRLIAEGSDPQDLHVLSPAAPMKPPMPARPGMGAEELYETLLPNVVQDQPCG
jgi:hypothetical protein